MQNDDLIQRQQALLTRSQTLRVNLAQQAEVFKGPLAIADRVGNGLRWLYQHPVWPLAALGIVVVLRPRSSIQWAGRIRRGWQAFKWAQDLIGSTRA